MNCFGGEFREAHEEELVGLKNHMLHFITDPLQLPDVPALLQFICLNTDLWPEYDVPLFQWINSFEVQRYNMRHPIVLQHYYIGEYDSL